MKICVPITGETIPSALEQIQQVQAAKADLLELRIDYLSDLTSDGLTELIKACSLPAIVTARMASEGGQWLGSEEERFIYLQQAVDSAVDFVDVEFRSDPQMRDQLIASKAKTKVIVSYHDFQLTPAYEQLERIYQEEMDLGADIGKVVTMAQNSDDNLTILRLVVAAQKQGQKIIALCMGEAGIMSRVAAPKMGSYLTFAAINRQSCSAPGQLTIEEMRSYLDTIVE